MAGANVCVGLLAHVSLVGIAFFVNGIGAGVWNVVTTAVRLQRTPEALLGRVTSAYQFLSRAPAPLGAVLGGVVAAEFGPRAPFIVAGVVVIPLCVLCLIPLLDESSGASRMQQRGT